MSELDEKRLLDLIARTACDLTGATFAAFTLRPIDETGQPLVPSEGHYFRLAAVVGVTREQEEMFHHTPLGGEGLLAPIFRHGVAVRIDDVLAHITWPATTEEASSQREQSMHAREDARTRAFAFAHGQLPSEDLRSIGVPAGHPLIRSFLGAPLLDHEKQVRGGLLLGHSEPARFCEEDELLLIGLATQAAVALENARLYHMAQMRAQELNAIFESIADGVTLLDPQRQIIRENSAARHLRETLRAQNNGGDALDALLLTPAQQALEGNEIRDLLVALHPDTDETREYLVSATSLHMPTNVPRDGISYRESDRSLSGAVVTWHNATERRVRESARIAKAHAEQLEAIFEAMSDAVLVYDNTATVVQMNTAARALFAVDGDLTTLTRLTRHDVYDAQGHILARAAWPVPRILNGEVLAGSNALDLTIHTLAGREIQVNISGAPILDHGEHIVGAVIVARDVAERKQAERLREQQAQKLRVQANLINLAHDAILVRDPHNTIVSWNLGAQELYGWTAEEAIGQDSNRLLHTPGRQNDVDIQTQLEQEGQWSGEITHTRRDGSQVFVESRQLLMRDNANRASAILEINRDITERRRLEQAEREARNEAEARLSLLQVVLDELPSSVYLVRGKDARLVLANRATAAVWGEQWQIDEPLITFLRRKGVRVFHEDGRPLPLEQLVTLRSVQHGENIPQHQESIRHADGTTLPVLVNAVTLDIEQLHLPTHNSNSTSEEGEHAAVVVHQDVTALKETERLKDEFIGLAAHELRTPLTILKGFAQTLIVQTARGKGPELADWQIEALQSIDQATVRMVELTEDLLDVTRLQAGRLELHIVPTDLVALIQRLVARLQVTTEQHEFSIHSNLLHLVIRVDAKRIEQVLNNLLHNAIKYSPEGGSIEIDISEQKESRLALISIRDYGIGIPAHQQARIFSRFVRGDNTHAYGIGGTGLGLYLSRELVERHHGRIWFQSVEDKGSTFYVALPLNSSEAQTPDQ